MSEIKKVHVLSLGTGYAETASWAQVFIANVKGFDTVQHALARLGHIFVEAIEEEIGPNREIFLSKEIKNLIHGNFQYLGGFWEMASNDGWYVGNAWWHCIEPLIVKHGVCVIDNANNLIQLMHENQLFDNTQLMYLYEDIKTPDGVRKFIQDTHWNSLP